MSTKGQTPTALDEAAGSDGRLTAAQQRQIEALGDGEWHKYNGRRLGIIERLSAIGLVEYEYLPGGVFGMPNWFRARLRPNSSGQTRPAEPL